MSHVGAAMVESHHIGSHILLVTLALFFIIAIWWADTTSLDEVTKGEGKVIPSSKVQVIQNLEGGILAEVLISEGELVDKDQILLKIDDTRFSSSFREVELKYYELLAKSSRLSAESSGNDLTFSDELINIQPSIVKNETALYESRQLELDSTISILQQQIAQREQELVEKKSKLKQLQTSLRLGNEELAMSEPLVKVGVMSEVELLRLKRTVNDLRGEMNATRLSIPRIKSAIDEVSKKIEEKVTIFKAGSAQQLADINGELARIKENIFSLEDKVTRTNVRSPVKGTIKQLKINTVGGIIQPGMDLVEIVPAEDKLLIEAKIRPADIAFLRPDQDAMIKLTAYDFSIYGGLRAKLERVSADTITDENGDSFYLIYLRTEKNYIEKQKSRLDIIPGMVATVDILTGKKTILDYLLKPILKAKQEALRER
ncbi:MAG TPA: HlyD family type I secretion periplasmic adaptor subunit [Gammaproteobacteria bacterium]|nr:HlyD family type I secretion periplasmic adaptor subunit [Gammaproteobacteria bacterium]